MEQVVDRNTFISSFKSNIVNRAPRAFMLFLALLLAGNVALAPRGLGYQLLLVAQLTVYVVAALGLLSLRFREMRLGGIPFYFVMSNAAMAVGLLKGLFNLQPVTWAQAERTRTGRHQKSPTPQ